MDISDKDFNMWNEVKKMTHRKIIPIDFFFREREIWWCSLGTNVGIEANGKHEFFERPILVFKIFNKEMIWAMPISSKVKNASFYHRFEFAGMSYSVNMTQIRTLDTKRLRRKVGTMTDEDFAHIIEMIVNIIKRNPSIKEGNLGARRR